MGQIVWNLSQDQVWSEDYARQIDFWYHSKWWPGGHLGCKHTWSHNSNNTNWISFKLQPGVGRRGRYPMITPSLQGSCSRDKVILLHLAQLAWLASSARLGTKFTDNVAEKWVNWEPQTLVVGALCGQEWIVVGLIWRLFEINTLVTNTVRSQIRQNLMCHNCGQRFVPFYRLYIIIPPKNNRNNFYYHSFGDMTVILWPEPCSEVMCGFGCLVADWTKHTSERRNR